MSTVLVASDSATVVITADPHAPQASAVKDNPVQDVLSNGQKSSRFGLSRSSGAMKATSPPQLKRMSSATSLFKRTPKDKDKEGNKTNNKAPTSPRGNPQPLRRSRAITLSASAPQLVPDKRPNVRERSNSIPFPLDLIPKSLDEIWDEVELHWDDVYSLHGKLTGLLYKKGIPEERREFFWTKISNIIPNTELLKCSFEEREGPEHRCIYKKLLEMKDTSHEHQITADITRTFPSEEHVYDPAFQKSLFNVLKAFSLYDSNVGYCQGLSFVAALLLTHIKEEQAFFMLIRLLKGHNLRSFYTEDMQGVKLRMFQMNKLSKFLFPSMHKHMEDLGVSIAVITAPWLMTAFGYQLPLDVALRVADVILFEGIPALFRIALAILVLCEQEIVQLSVDEVMDYFRDNLKTKFQDPQLLMSTAYSVNISLSQLDSLEYEFLQNELAAEKVEVEFGHKSAEDIEELENTVRYSQVLVGNHELSETLVVKNNEYQQLLKQFDGFQKKAESEKIALVEKLGKMLDKLNIVESEKNKLAEKVVKAESNLVQAQLQCSQMTECCQALAQEVHKLKKKTGKPRPMASSG